MVSIGHLKYVDETLSPRYTLFLDRSYPPGRSPSLGIRNLLRLRYTPLMGSRASRIAVTLALLTCLICPLVEMFDTWDHTVETGNDTEYAFVVLALCVGVAYLSARFIFRSTLLGSVTKAAFACCLRTTFFNSTCCPTVLPLEATSPPLLLRI